MKRDHPLEAFHESQVNSNPPPSVSHTRLLHSVVKIMAWWGDGGGTAFEIAEKIVALVRKTDADTAERAKRTNLTMGG